MDWDIIEPILIDQVKQNLTFTSGYHQIKNILAKKSLEALIDNVDENRLQAEFSEWINEIFSKRIPNNVKSLYFGLFSMVDPDDDSEEITTVYFCGPALTPQEDDDWACWDNNTFLPENKYIVLTDFVVIDQNIKQNSDNSGDINVLIFHGLLNLLIINSVAQIRNSLIATHKSLYIGSGFDGGDILVIGKLTESGLQ